MMFVSIGLVFVIATLTLLIRMSQNLAIFSNIVLLAIVEGLVLFGLFDASFYENYFLLVDSMSYVLVALIVFLQMMFLGVSSHSELKKEFLAMSNFALFGMMCMAISAEFITLLIALEIASLSFYALIAFEKEKMAIEAALKYFLFSAFISAFYLLGVALIFGMYKTTSFASLNIQEVGLVNILSFVLVISTALFKITAFGFHSWSIDVYYGTKTSITALLSSAFKIAAFVMLIRVSANFVDFGQGILYIMAILTMFVGNMISLKETRLKRLLIASSIVHSGYLLVAISSASSLDSPMIADAIFYLFAYTIAIMGVFAIVASLYKTRKHLRLQDLQGLYKTHPIESFALAVFCLSFIGFPYTIGFFGKLYIFMGALENSHTDLAIFAIINTIISVYYYLKVIINIYFYPPTGEILRPSTNILKTITIALIAIVLLGGFGFYSIDQFLKIL